MFWWSNNCWGSTLPKVMGKIQKSPSQDFIDFAIKTHQKMIFFTNFSQVSVIFIYYCLILLYLNDFKLKQRKQILKSSFQFSMGFHCKIYEIMAWAFRIFPITLGKVDPQQRFDHQNIPNWSPQKFLISLPKILAGFGDNLKKPWGSNFFQLVPMIKKWKKKFFCFPWCGYIQFCSVSIPDYKNVICLLVLPGWTIPRLSKQTNVQWNR